MARGDVITNLGLTGNPQDIQPASGVEWLITQLVANVTSGTEVQGAGSEGLQQDLGAGNTGLVNSSDSLVWARKDRIALTLTNAEYIRFSGVSTKGYFGVQTK